MLRIRLASGKLTKGHYKSRRETAKGEKAGAISIGANVSCAKDIFTFAADPRGWEGNRFGDLNKERNI